MEDIPNAGKKKTNIGHLSQFYSKCYAEKRKLLLIKREKRINKKEEKKYEIKLICR